MKRINPVYAARFDEAQQLLTNHHELFSAIVSISDREDELMPQSLTLNTYCLRLIFTDTDGRQPEIAMSLEQAQTLYDALPTITQGTGTILVHCSAGLCRSPAVAYVIMAYQFGPGNEAKAYAELSKLNPVMLPNEWVLSQCEKVMPGFKLLPIANK